jgi:hypothetical protein
MSKRYGLLIVEGPHDQAFVARVLRCLGFSRFDGKVDKLDRVWEPWKPTYPKNGYLYAPLDMPTIMFNTDWSIGVMRGEGDGLYSPQKGLPLRLRNNSIFVSTLHENGAIGFVVDADENPPEVRTQKIHDAYSPLFSHLSATPGQIMAGPPRTGSFVIPNNKDPGTVETVLWPLGQTHYAELLEYADTFVRACEPELTQHFKPFDHLKARVATAASILQPGSTNTITIERDKWITSSQLSQEPLVPFIRFLEELFELPKSS